MAYLESRRSRNFLRVRDHVTRTYQEALGSAAPLVLPEVSPFDDLDTLVSNIRDPDHLQVHMDDTRAAHATAVKLHPITSRSYQTAHKSQRRNNNINNIII